jgi:hypothetical protein
VFVCRLYLSIYLSIYPVGWAEALGQEYETLSYQLQFSREEMRLVRNQIKSRQRELLELQVELEETEMDMDTMEVYAGLCCAVPVLCVCVCVWS